eukprot:TRINITY_DN52081_c0_g1_i1.p2 TRINITY_DN52081_c0_g1~~TRINITY_DN52081_c0_g1_i1.p2  ORF type:complete len:115 (+),score=41.43 TRINITY_DN52081_c0_g1_i1:263-607(+)
MSPEDDVVFCTLIDKLSDDKFALFLDDWCTKHCTLFGNSEEFTHEHKHLHDQYIRIYESRCEAVLNEASVTRDEFVKMCKCSDDPDVSTLVAVISAVADFDIFNQMMVMKKMDM